LFYQFVGLRATYPKRQTQHNNDFISHKNMDLRKCVNKRMLAFICKHRNAINSVLNGRTC